MPGPGAGTVGSAGESADRGLVDGVVVAEADGEDAAGVVSRMQYSSRVVGAAGRGRSNVTRAKPVRSPLTRCCPGCLPVTRPWAS